MTISRRRCAQPLVSLSTSAQRTRRMTGEPRLVELSQTLSHSTVSASVNRLIIFFSAHTTHTLVHGMKRAQGTKPEYQ